LVPGQRGTKKLLAEYGDRLVRVRYRYDEPTGRSFKTIELIVEEGTSASPSDSPDRRPGPSHRLVGLRVDWEELEIRRRLKAVGATWNPGERLWECRHDLAVDLGLEARIVRDPCI